MVTGVIILYQIASVPNLALISQRWRLVVVGSFERCNMHLVGGVEVVSWLRQPPRFPAAQPRQMLKALAVARQT